MRKQGRARWPVLALVAGAAVVLTAWELHSWLKEPVGVTVASPEYRDVANLVTTNGLVEPMAEFQARANFGGMVDKVLVELGDTVNTGQMLVTMKDPFAVARIATAASALSAAEDAEQNMGSGGTEEERIGLRADLEHAKQSRDGAQNFLRTLEQLQQQGGAASAGEVDNARRRLADAEATLQMLQQRATERYDAADLKASHDRLADAQASLGAARMTFRNANIASPIRGTVYSVSAVPYDFVPMGADLLRVADLNKMQIRSYFDEPEVGKLKAGQPVTVTWDGRPGLVWHGHIRQAPVGAKQMGDRSVAECLITLDDAKGDLLPNTHVVVTVPIEAHKRVLTVPRQALQADSSGTSVYRVVHGKLDRTSVQVGLMNLDLVEIEGGLTPQDVVALHTVTEEPLSNHLAVSPSR